jgi:hypothetical protein
VTVEIIALALTLLVHIVGAGVLIWALLDGEEVDWRGLWPRDDGGGGGGPELPQPPDPDGGGILSPLPMPDAAPSAVRLREPARIGDGYPRPARRPAHAPERPRVPERS